MPASKKIRPKRAAKLSGYSYEHICKLAREGVLARYYFGTTRSYLLDRNEVLELAKERT